MLRRFASYASGVAVIVLAVALGQSRCEVPVSAPTWVERTRRAENALAALDSAAFLADSEWVWAAIPCLAEVPSPEQSAAINDLPAVMAGI
ncbi:MAG: hypothetical protein ACJA00_004480 [Myxococcota bacterium]